MEIMIKMLITITIILVPFLLSFESLSSSEESLSKISSRI